jgi:hypothetical protein
VDALVQTIGGCGGVARMDRPATSALPADSRGGRSTGRETNMRSKYLKKSESAAVICLGLILPVVAATGCRG